MIHNYLQSIIYPVKMSSLMCFTRDDHFSVTYLSSSHCVVGCLAWSVQGYCRDIRPEWQKSSHRQQFLLTQQKAKMDGAQQPDSAAHRPHRRVATKPGICGYRVLEPLHHCHHSQEKYIKIPNAQGTKNIAYFGLILSKQTKTRIMHFMKQVCYRS